MHKSILALVLLGFVSLVQGATPGPAELEPGMQNPGYQEKPDWFKQSFLDIREDLADATAADRRLILYFHQDGCPYCAKLLQEGLGDRTVGALARERFDWVAINIWGDREVTGFSGEPTTEKQFAADLKVQFTPTLLLLDEGGKVVLRINGYFPPHKLAAALTYVAERREQVGETYADFLATRNPAQAKGKLHEEGGFLPRPVRLADNRDVSARPLVVMFEQPTCKDCDELHEDILRREPVAYSLTAFDAAIIDAYSKEPVQTPDGREIPARDWAAELGIEYTPSLVFFDAAGREVFRTEGFLKAFHIHGALDYVATGAYIHQPSFQRYLAARREALAARRIHADLME
ncbi:MAG: thioredoxin family protein [Bdellovibrio bacteriovorus]